MNRSAKVGLVGAGYLLAPVAGVVASWLYDARVSKLPIDTSGGMYAGGNLMASLAAFLTVALVPTLLALWFLRKNEALWRAIAVASLVFASAGLIAVLIPRAAHDPRQNLPMVLLELLGLAQLLGVPFWTLAIVLFAVLAPTRPVRRLLVVAIGLELVIAVCAAIHWFVPSSPL